MICEIQIISVERMIRVKYREKDMVDDSEEKELWGQLGGCSSGGNGGGKEELGTGKRGREQGEEIGRGGTLKGGPKCDGKCNG